MSGAVTPFSKEEWKYLRWIKSQLKGTSHGYGPYPWSVVDFLFRKVMQLSGHKHETK